MSKDNPAWEGKIVIARYGPDGKVIATSVSNTRQTRDAAYPYLLNETDLGADFAAGRTR
jgi:hypothetical protein